MSTKTITVDTRVYEKLAGVKLVGESFSKAIDRLIDEVHTVHTGQGILRGLAEVAELSIEDAQEMLSAVNENRESESIDLLDLESALKAKHKGVSLGEMDEAIHSRNRRGFSKT